MTAPTAAADGHRGIMPWQIIQVRAFPDVSIRYCRMSA